MHFVHREQGLIRKCRNSRCSGHLRVTYDRKPVEMKVLVATVRWKGEELRKERVGKE